MLKSDADGNAESINDTADRTAFLGYRHEQFADLTVFEKIDTRVTLMPADAEPVGQAESGCR